MNCLEGEVVATLPAVTGDLTHEFQSGQACACQEPVPHVESYEHDAKRAIQYRQEVHHVTVIAVVVVIPHAHDREEEVNQAKEQVEQEEDEEAIVLHPDTVVNPRAMMIHVENTFIANGTVVRPCWLHFIAGEALTAPYLPQLFNSLCAVLH